MTEQTPGEAAAPADGPAVAAAVAAAATPPATGTSPAAGAPEAPVRVITSDDLFRLRWISEPRLSPDGGLAAFTLTTLDAERDLIVSRVAWTPTSSMSTFAGEVRSESPVGGRDRDAQWSPDGRRLAFVSNRSGRDQIWVVDTGMMSARPVTDSPTGASSPAWSPDGHAIAYVAAETIPDRGAGPYTIDVAHFRTDGVGNVPRAVHRHVWVVPVDGGPARRIGDVPTDTDGDWDDDLPRWSPDGSTIAVRSNRTGQLFTQTSELWLIPVEGGPQRRIVDAVGVIRQVAWSPDGRSIAYSGHQRGEDQGVNFGLWLVDVASGAARNLTESLDRSIGLTIRADPPGPFLAPDLAWAPDGSACYAIHPEHGTSRIVRVGVDGSVIPVVAGERGAFAFSVAAHAGTLAFLASSPDDLGDLRVCDASGGDERTITATNTDWLASVRLGRLERFEFDAADGTRLEAWIQHPASRPATERLPLVLSIHGGPHWPLGNRFCFDFRRMAEQGQRVLFLNPRGSQGYGEAYALANRGAWGDLDASDLLKAVEVAAARPDVDPDRVAVMGESYGGFMTNWLIGTTKRFRAAVSQSCISDLRSEFLTTDDPPGMGWEFFGAPWEQPDRYEHYSPITHVQGVTTPLLLIHSELDGNCPINQSEQMYMALTVLGREVEFLRLPGEGHLINLVGRPSSRLARSAAIDRFLLRHLHA